MKKVVLLLTLSLLALQTVWAQDNRKIRYRADMGFYDEEYIPGAQRLIGNVAFAQDNVRGYCDSAYLYDAENYIIAFGNHSYQWEKGSILTNATCNGVTCDFVYDLLDNVAIKKTTSGTTRYIWPSLHRSVWKKARPIC